MGKKNFPFPIFDADGHVMEDEDEIMKYMEGDYAGFERLKLFSIFPGVDGWSRGMIKMPTSGKPRSTKTDVEIWAEMLDDMGCEGSVLYPTAALSVGLMKDLPVANAVTNAYNNWLEDQYTRQDDRLLGVGLMAVQDPVSAARELRRCAGDRKNFVAMMLPGGVTHPARTYGDEFFWPIYEAAQECDMPLAIHGGPSGGMGFDHFNSFEKIHTLSHPMGLQIQLTDIIFSGVFDAFPKLRIAFLEGGCTWVPFMMDRLDYEYDSAFGRKARATLKKRPSEYISEGDNFWVSPELGEKFLRYTIDAMGGADRLLYASDFPHEPAPDDIIGDIPNLLNHPGYTDEEKQWILGGAARRFYGLQ